MSIKTILALSIAVALGGCGTSPYEAPPAKPGKVIWLMVAPENIAAACSLSPGSRETGCTRGTEIITRPPQWGDGDLAGLLQHEVAHVQGWRHPPWPDGTP